MLQQSQIRLWLCHLFFTKHLQATASINITQTFVISKYLPLQKPANIDINYWESPFCKNIYRSLFLYFSFQIDCQYSRADYHRHRSHDGLLPTCSCTYCKDFPVRPSYSPSRRDFLPRHHMDGASVKSNDNSRAVPNGVPTTPPGNNAVTNHSPSNNEKSKNEDTDTEMTTLKMKLPDIRKGGTSVQISLEICGVTYEGVIKAVHSMTNGFSERNNNRTNKNNNNNNFDILDKEQNSTQMIASK